MGRPARNLAANTGTTVRLMTIDTSTAIDSDQLRAAKNCPQTPTMNASGTNTSTVVSVEPMTAPVISPEAASTGSVGAGGTRSGAREGPACPLASTFTPSVLAPDSWPLTPGA